MALLPQQQLGAPQLPKGLQAISKGYSPQSQGILNQLGPMALQGIQQNSNIEPILQRARSQFNTQTIPGLAERFTSLGGGQRSSAFQGAIGQASTGLEEGLASLGIQHQQSLLPFLAQLLGMGLQPQYDVIQTAREPGFWERFLGGASQGASASLPLLAASGGTAWPAALAAGLGGFSSGFSGGGQSQSNQLGGIGNNNQLQQLLALLGRQ